MVAILKFIWLFLSVWWTIINFVKLIRGHKIPAGNVILQVVGITGFIYLQWLM